MDIHTFEKKVRKYYELIITSTIISIDEEKIKNLEFQKEYYIRVHNSWKKAQNEIFEDLMRLTVELSESKERLKNARRNREEKKIKEEESNQNNLSFQEIVLRKLIDSIAWTIVGLQDDVVKALYKQLSTQSLLSSNIEDEWNYIKEYNNKNPLKFALYSDLSSFIQVGDALIIDCTKKQRQISIVEIKSGEKNFELRKLIDEIETINCTGHMYLSTKDLNKKDFSQLTRMLKQEVKLAETSELINKQEIELPEQMFRKIVDFNGEELEFDTLIPIIEKKIELAHEYELSIARIDNCLYIGISYMNTDFKNQFSKEMENQDVKYEKFYYHQVLGDPPCFPLFHHNFKENDLFDILFGRIQIAFCFDFDKWIELAKEGGLNCYWLSRSETQKIINSVPKEYRPYVFNNRILRMTNDDPKKVYYFGFGLIMKMIASYLSPKYLISLFTQKTKSESALKGKVIHNKKNIHNKKIVLNKRKRWRNKLKSKIEIEKKK